MRLSILVLVAGLAISGAAAAEDGVGPAARETIQQQLDAFEADDFARAFGFAAPGIRQVFRTPENFGSMVRNGYPMVWRPGKVEFLDLHPKAGGTWQRVRITDRQGQNFVLDYQILETPDGVRIGAVEILKPEGVGV